MSTPYIRQTARDVKDALHKAEVVSQHGRTEKQRLMALAIADALRWVLDEQDPNQHSIIRHIIEKD